MMKPHLLILPMLLLCLQASATSILPVPLTQMASTADVIFHGRVLGNEVKQDQTSGQVATFTQFEVIEAVKGNPGKIHTIKQIGGTLPDKNVRLVVHGVPRFAVGGEYIVFLPKASALGFSSPIGLSQGKFDIRRLNDEAIVSNGRPLTTLPKTSAQQTLPNIPSAIVAGPTPGLKTLPGHSDRALLSDFLRTVRGMIKE